MTCVSTRSLPAIIVVVISFFLFLTPATTTAYTVSSFSNGNNNVNNDWKEAISILQDFPFEPNPKLSVEQVAMGCLRCIQMDQVERIVPYLTTECKGVVTNRTPKEFTIERATYNPLFQTIMGATKLQFQPIDEYDSDESDRSPIPQGERSRKERRQPPPPPSYYTISPGTKFRGDIATFGVIVHGSDSSTFQHRSGFLRDGVRQTPTISNFILRLERQRQGEPSSTPLHGGCWLVREISDIRFAKGGQGWSRHEGV